MATIKLVTIDIDGTLITDDYQIPADVKAAVQRAIAQGVHIVITTGRPLTGVRHILEELGIQGADQYVITYNGALTATADGQQTLNQAALAYADFCRVDDFLQAHDTYVQVEGLDTAYTTRRQIGVWANYENNLVRLPLVVCDQRADLQQRDFIKAIATAETADLDQLQSQVPADIADTMTVIRSTPNNLEFIHPSASKGNALRALADRLGLTIAETMAIGDQENDASMIAAAGLGVAMGNAVPSIKALADVETATNNASGVARALETYVLEDKS